MPRQELVIGSTMLVRFDGMRNASTRVYVVDATFTWTLKDSAGTTITSGSLSYVTDSKGRYEGTISAATTAALTAGSTYTVTLTGTSGSGTVRRDLNPVAVYGRA